MAQRKGVQAPVQGGFEFEAGEPARLTHWDPEHWPVASSWAPVIRTFLASTAGLQLASFIQSRLDAGAVIYPPKPFRALELTPLDKVRAVILGQDPYHGSGQAEGLAFSVREGLKLPPSLRNIFKEWRQSPDEPLPMSGSLTDWAARGVLLLNSSLTVEEGQPGSHVGKGWEVLTDALLAEVAASASPCVYMLWGVHAQQKARTIHDLAQRNGRHALVLQANHPSPLSANRSPLPFTGCGHFARARTWLSARGCHGVF